MSDYRVRISIRNERLLSAIEEAGYSSARQCSIANGYPEPFVGQLVNGTRKPLDSKTGKPTKFCKEILQILGKNIEDCFSYQVKVDEKELKQLVSNHKNEGHTLLESDLDRKISEVLSIRLTPRQEKIVRMHFGLGKYKEHTVTELAKYYNLSTSRLGQILDKAVLKLKHVGSASLLLSTGFYDKFTKVNVSSTDIIEAEEYLQKEKSMTTQ